MTSRSVFPSDGPPVNSERPFSLCGRVSFVSSEKIIVSDALAHQVIHREAASELLPPIAPGDLVELEVEQRDAPTPKLWLRQTIAVHAAPEPSAGSEFSRLQNHERGRLLQKRAEALTVIRGYFAEQRFVEVETPTFVPCPGLDAHVHSLAQVQRTDRVDHLITSPELHMKRLLSGGMPRIFQFARCFRAEELGRWHEPEFTLLEWYRAFAGFAEILGDTEEVVCRVFECLCPSGNYPGGRIQRPFMQITVRDAFREFASLDDAVALAEQDPESYFDTLVNQVEPELANLGLPVFLTHYPLSQAALARPCPQDPTVAERFELYLGEVEISNGFGELTDEPLQRARFLAEKQRRVAANEPDYPLDERFLAALRQGVPPSAGNALGIDRLIALATGSSELAHTLAFADSER